MLKRVFSMLIGALFALTLFSTASAQADQLLSPVTSTEVQQTAALPPLATPTISTTFEVQAGQIITVPLMIENITGRGYISFQGDLSVDPHVLKIVRIIANYGTTVAWVDNVHHNFIIPGAGLRFGAMNYREWEWRTEWEGKQPLFLIVLEAVGDPGEFSVVGLENLLLNEERFDTILGKVTISLPIVSGQAFYHGDESRPMPNVSYRLGSPVKDYSVVSRTGAFSFKVEPETYTLYASKVNDQGNAISAYDAALVMRCAIGLANDCDPEIADVYQDGDITAYDAGLILWYSVGLEDKSGLSVTGHWFRTDANRWPRPITQDTVLNVSYSLRGDVSGNWGMIPVAAASDSVRVFAEDGQLVIQSTEEFLSVEITVEENTSLLGVQDWTFQKNGNLLGGYSNNNLVAELRIPMDGHVLSVRLDEREVIAVNLWVDQNQAVFLPITMGQ